MELNFKEAFTSMFKDEKFWQKYLIGTVFMIFTLLPLYSVTYNPFDFNHHISLKEIINSNLMMLVSFVVGVVNAGYAATYAKSKISTTSDNLPEWSGNLGHIVFNGLKFFAGCILFYIPLYLITYIITLLIAVVFIIICACFMGLTGITMNSPDFFTFAVVAGIILFLIFTPVIFAFGMCFQIGTSSFLTDLKPLSFYNFKRIKNMAKKNLLNSFIIVLFPIPLVIALLALYIWSVDLYFIIAGVLGFYSMLIMNNLMAQYAQIGMKKHLERLEAEK